MNLGHFAGDIKSAKKSGTRTSHNYFDFNEIIFPELLLSFAVELCTLKT